MLQWPWHKKQEKIVYVPIVLAGTHQTYEQKWRDRNYLETVHGLKCNEVFISEIVERIRCLREKADTADSVDVLKGLQAGIKELKLLLAVPEYAKAQMRNLENEGNDG